MKLKRFLAVSAACAVAAAGISVQAGAAGRFRLLTEPFSTVDGAIDVDIPNNGIREYMSLGYLNDEVNGIDGLFDITADDLDSWRETGEFAYTKVEGDFNFDRDVRIFSDCLGMCYLDAEGNIAERFAVRYDVEGKLDITKQSEDYFFPTLDGWILDYEDAEGEEQSTLTITATSPDGKTISKEIQYDTGYTVAFAPAGDYLAYIMYATETTDSIYKDSENWGEYDTCFDVRVDVLTKDGELKNIYSGEKPSDGLGIIGFNKLNVGEDYFAFFENKAARATESSVFFSDTGNVVTFNVDFQRIDMSDYQNDSDESIVADIYYFSTVEDRQGDNIILSYQPSYSEYGSKDKLYRLARDNTVDYGDYLVRIDGDISISDTYKHMSTKDGELYLVQTLDDKWGFMNADGELLATYDDAGSFIGKYAPVIKDGKAFLINRDLKRVSEKIDAESVRTIDKGLYYVTINGEKYFMTYAAAQEEQTENPEDKPEEPAETTEPSKPAETSEPSEPSEPEQPDTPAETAQTAEAAGDNSGDNGADKTNPDTGAASAAAVLGLGVIAAGAVILSRKRG